MKKYYVYLDESGDFETDLEEGNGLNPSLVGGFFYNSKEKIEINKLQKKIDDIKKGENHANEMSGEYKKNMVYNMLTASKKYPIEFLIFEDDKKKKIVNSTQTYLTVITEGLIQLMKRLVILENEDVELNVIAGFKKDTTQKITNSYITGYIDINEYQNRIKEKLSIEKAKLHNDIFQKSIIKIQLADDKRDSFLILCDYICNFWYTRQARIFKGSIKKNGIEVSVREILKKLYNKDYIFPLFCTEEDDHVIRMVQDGLYADALFEICVGMISDTNSELIKKSFIKLRQKQIHRQLDNLIEYIGDMIIFRQSEKLIEKVLEGAEEIYKFLKCNGFEDQKFYLNLKLYWLAYYNSMSQYSRMEELFQSIEKDIAQYTLQTLDMECMFIYYIRWAVYLLDNKKYQECCDLCDNMELLLNFVEEDIRKNGIIKIEGKIKSEQLGKVLGTKLQAQISLCYLNKLKSDVARDTSDRAMEQFTFLYDLKRQYQYRAELEAVCGKQADALFWLEKSFGGENWKKYINSSSKDIFDIYNLLYVAAMTKSVNANMSLEIANHVYNSCRGDIIQNLNMKGICMFLMGYSMLDDNKFDARGKLILEKLINNEVKDKVTKAAELSLEGKNGLNILF